jgi:3-oxoacyl-[acyl-carrier protein] reductase
MKTALILGAGGVGRAIAMRLKADDVRVLLVGRSTAAAEELGVEGTAVDLASESDVRAMCLWVAQLGVSLDLVVVASGDMAGRTMDETSVAELSALMANNVNPVFFALTQVTPLLAPEAHRVVLGAYVDRLAFPKLGPYAAAKAAVDALVRVALKEQRSLKTTMLRLPAVDTPLWKKAPFPLPKGALTAAGVAESVVTVWREGKVGVVDL